MNLNFLCLRTWKHFEVKKRSILDFFSFYTFRCVDVMSLNRISHSSFYVQMAIFDIFLFLVQILNQNKSKQMRISEKGWKLWVLVWKLKLICSMFPAFVFISFIGSFATIVAPFCYSISLNGPFTVHH